MLRETTIMFLLGYFYPGCEDENRLPPTRMVRMELTTCFSAKNTEDLENSIGNYKNKKYAIKNVTILLKNTSCF